MELLVCMSIAGSIPVVICLLLYIIQREDYNYILGRRLLLTGVFFYLVPVQLVKYLLPKDALPETMLMGRKADSYLSGSLSFWSEKQGDYIWLPQWFNIFARVWLAGIIIFAIYEIVKYWRGAHSIRNYIFEKIDDPEDNLTYYLIPDGICGPCTIGFFRQKIAIPESFLLVLEASTSDIRPAVWKNNLSGHKNNKEGKDFKTLKRRITYMMKEKRKGMLQRGIMVAVSALTVVASAGTVMAYQPAQSSDESFEEFISDDSIYDFGFDDVNDSILNFIDFSESDTVYVDADGNEMVCQESSDTYALCTHSMIPATFYTHSKNSSGGCTIKVYTCQRCEKCGYSANAKYSHTITYTKCTH